MMNHSVRLRRTRVNPLRKDALPLRGVGQALAPQPNSEGSHQAPQLGPALVDPLQMSLLAALHTELGAAPVPVTPLLTRSSTCRVYRAGVLLPLPRSNCISKRC